MFFGMAMMEAGAGAVAVGGVAEVASVGVLTPVAVPVAAAGGVVFVAGAGVFVNGGYHFMDNVQRFPDGGGGGGVPPVSPAISAAETASHQAAQRFNALADAEKKAVSAAMNEFATGEPGARQLLEAVRKGDRVMPTTFSKASLSVYRDAIQAKYDLIVGKGLIPPEVMRLRLEIYKIWLGP